MKMRVFNSVVLVLSLFLVAFTSIKEYGDTQKYKCMVQLKNYEGEGAYLIVSLVDKNDNYLKTLHILGEDEKWYADLVDWWAFYETGQPSGVDATTGATIAGGERSVFTFNLEESDVKDGNKLRFETAVEHQEHYVKDLEISLEESNLKNKFQGTGYIRYVKIIPN